MNGEKIITAMEWCRENPCNGCPYEQNKDAEGRCTISDDTIILLKEQKEIVRCKDCRWYSEKGFCKHPNGGAGNVRPADWFCADGVRR